MTWLYKAGLILAIMAGLFISGAVVGYRFREPEVVVKTEIVEKVNTVIKTVIVTEVKPDGTKTTTETSSSETVSTETTGSEPTPEPVPHSPNAVRFNKFSLGVGWTPRIDKEVYKPTSLEVGRRLWDTGAWGTVGYNWRTKEATLFLRVEF